MEQKNSIHLQHKIVDRSQNCCPHASSRKLKKVKIRAAYYDPGPTSLLSNVSFNRKLQCEEEREG